MREKPSFDQFAKRKGIEKKEETKKPSQPSPLYTQAEVRLALDDLSRKPFADFLALLLGAHPTEQNIRDFANRNPDKWSSAVNLFSKMTGYSDQIEVTHNVYHAVRVMSDMDLEGLLRETNNKIGDSYLVEPSLIIAPDGTYLPPEKDSLQKQNGRKQISKEAPHRYIELPDGRLIRKRAKPGNGRKAIPKSKKLFEETP